MVLPAQLREFSGGAGTLELGTALVLREALRTLKERHSFVHHRILTETGHLRPHVNIFVDGEDIRFLNGLDTPLQKGSEILVIPAVSGG